MRNQTDRFYFVAVDAAQPDGRTLLDKRNSSRIVRLGTCRRVSSV